MRRSKLTVFPTLEEALYLHKLLIERYGGAPEILDLGLLESALARPRSGYYKSLSEQAAALLHSLVKNHAFADGNKRMALALTAAFLLMNDYELLTSADESESFILEVAASNAPDAIKQIVQWIEANMNGIKNK